MKQYEYRLVVLEFDGSAREGQLNGQVIRKLMPGERVIETFNTPEFISDTGNWFVSVLVERESTSFHIRDLDHEELTQILKGQS